MRLGLAAAVAAIAVASASAASGPPALEVRSLAPFSIRGTHFQPFERVRVTLNRTWASSAVASGAGVVVVTIRGAAADRCDGYTATAAGSRGSRAMLVARPLACASTNPG